MSESKKAPVWFMVVAAFLLLWNLLGIASFVFHISITEEAIALIPDPKERDLYTQYPVWVLVTFAVATFAGFSGALMLVLKRRIAKQLFIISLLAILVQMGHNIFMTTSIEVYGAGQALFMPVLVIIFGFVCLWIANIGVKKNWLK